MRVDPSPSSSMVIISDPMTISRSDAESDSGRGALGRPGNDSSRRQRAHRKVRSPSPVRGMNKNRSGAHSGSRIREEASARRSRSEARTKATSMATGRGRSRRRSYGDTRTTGANASKQTAATGASQDPVSVVKRVLRQPPRGVSRVSRADSWIDNVEQLLDSALRAAARKRGYRSRVASARRGTGTRNGKPAARASAKSTRVDETASHSVATPCKNTEDLRHKLNKRRREAEDARITIERSRERTRDRSIVRTEEYTSARRGRSAERTRRTTVQISDSDSESSRDVPPKRKARVEDNSFTGGCAALSSRLRRVAWPHKFRPDLPERYDGTAPPGEFLQIYSTAVKAAGGTEDVMANYFHIALKDSARSWFMNLAPKSISSWEQLCREFMANFQGTSKRPGSQIDLDRVVQKPGETLRQFMQRFSQVRNTIPRMEPARVIAAFGHGVRDKDMLGELGVHAPETVTELFKLADKCALRQEAQAWHDPPTKTNVKQDTGGSGMSKTQKKKLQKQQKKGQVAAVGAQPPRQPRANPGAAAAAKQAGKKFCALHQSTEHDQTECRYIQAQIKRRQERKAAMDKGKAAAEEEEDNEELNAFQDAEDSILVISGGSSSFSSRREVKLLRREICAFQQGKAEVKRVKWSDVPITFDRDDMSGPDNSEGKIPLVVSPVIANKKVGRTLIDGGASLNLITPRVFKMLQCEESELKPARPFLGVIPGEAQPLGRISLPVTFGSRENFRTEKLMFEVAELNLPYNAIIGRPGMNKFMAVPHYAYLVLKIPGPKGVISERVDWARAVACIEETLPAELAVGEQGNAVMKTDPGAAHTKKMAPGAVETKKIALDESGSKTTTIGAELDPK